MMIQVPILHTEWAKKDTKDVHEKLMKSVDLQQVYLELQTNICPYRNDFTRLRQLMRSPVP